MIDPLDWCEYCGDNPCRCSEADPASYGEPDEYDPGQTGPCPGHEFVCTGTAYGGDDESYFGEGRCYCIHCGADGDA